MINIWKKILKTGTVTKERETLSPSKKYHGKLAVDVNKCNNCQTCVFICPVSAIHVKEENNKATISFDYRTCMYCGLCAERCPEDAIVQTNKPKRSVKEPNDLIETFIIKQ